MRSLRCVTGLLAGLLAFSTPVVAQLTIFAVVNAASYDAGVAPGSIISIFGTGLASQTAQAASVPLPATLGGTSVTISGLGNVPLYFVSPTQINAVVPFQIPVLGSGSTSNGPAYLAAIPMVTVTTSVGTSKPRSKFARLFPACLLRPATGKATQ